MKVVVIGANGQLGTDVVRAFTKNGDDVCSMTHSDIELADIDSVSRSLRPTAPDIVVNTAAMHHVEACERDSTSAFAVNELGAKHLAQVALDLDCVLVHISTDYVFDGGKKTPYEENDAPCPLNVYGSSKLAGEGAVRDICPKHFVLRTSALYGASACRAKGGLNFVQLMLKLARERDELRVVDDEMVSPTATADVARQVIALSQSDAFGLYHATAEGSCSWYGFAKAIFSLKRLRVNLNRADPGEFPAKVPRPKYSVLENKALKTRHLNTFDAWEDGLGRYLNSL